MSAAYHYFKFFFVLLFFYLSGVQASSIFPHPNGSIDSISLVGIYKPKQLRPTPGKYDIRIQRVTYWSDDLRIVSYIATPVLKSNKKFPLVVWNRGGNRALSASTDQDIRSKIGWIASHGFFVMASNYRGSPGSEGKEEYGGKDVDDILNLLPLAKKFPEADLQHIGMIGFSRGGMMTYLVLKKTPRIKIAILNSGLADLIEMNRRPDMYPDFSALIKGYLTDKRNAVLEKRSALYWPEKVSKNTKMVILYGTADKKIMPDQQIKMAYALLKTHHSIDLWRFPHATHGLTEYRAAVRALTICYLNHFLF